MFQLVLLFISILSMFGEYETNEDHHLAGSVDNFTITSDLVRDFLEHFKNPDANNLPLPIPDPFIMPDRIYPVLGVKVSTANVTAHGISRVKIESFSTDIVGMKVHFRLKLEKLNLMGNYSYYDWLLTHYHGGFNVIIWNGYTECSAELEITSDGELSSEKINMDLIMSSDKTKNMDINIEGAGFVGYLVNAAGESLFYAIKPYFFSLISNNIRSTLNNGLKRIKITFPNSIAPLDLGVAEFRKFLKSNGFDPYYVADYQYASSIYSVDITQITVTGLSSIYRIGDVKMQMQNNTVNTMLTAETEVLEGSCEWEAGIAGILTKSGQSSFTIEYVNIMMSVNQSLDIRKKPKIVDLKVTLGNIQLRMDGAGTLDYLAEAAVNVLPNVLRYQILQAAETPMRRKIQEALDNSDIEKIVLDNLPMMDDQLYHRNVSKLEDDFVVEEPMTKLTDVDEEAEL